MVCEVQTATNENLCLTFLVSQSSAHETQAPGFHLVLFHVHETQAPGFHPVQECHHWIFMNLSVMFSACARMSSFSFHEFQSRVSPLIFHEFQSHVFTLCMHFTAYCSWISGPWFQPLWTISTFIFSYSLTPFHGFMFQSCQIHAPKPAAIPQKKNRSAIQEPTQGLHDARRRSNSCWFDHSWPMHSLSWAGPMGIHGHVFWPCLLCFSMFFRNFHTPRTKPKGFS